MPWGIIATWMTDHGGFGYITPEHDEFGVGFLPDDDNKDFFFTHWVIIGREVPAVGRSVRYAGHYEMGNGGWIWIVSSVEVLWEPAEPVTDQLPPVASSDSTDNGISDEETDDDTNTFHGTVADETDEEEEDSDETHEEELDSDETDETDEEEEDVSPLRSRVVRPPQFWPGLD